MATNTLPFYMENQIDEPGTDNRNLSEVLSPQLKEVAESNPHLLQYLQIVAASQIGIPSYYPKLSTEMGNNKKLNILYPVGSGIFAHIIADPQDSRSNYISIEPTTIMNVEAVMNEVENRCIEFADRLPDFDINSDKEKQLLGYIEKVTTLNAQPVSNFLDKYINRFRKNGSRLIKVRVTKRELEGIRYLFMRDKIGLGMLDPLIADQYIEDLSCSGLGQIFIEHKIFKGLKSTITFTTFEELDQFVLRLAEKIKKPINYSNPIADATLPGGSRINIVYGRDISKRGSNFSIRKFSEVPLSIFELVDFGTINYEMLAYLSLVLSNGLNVFIAGESASGKTAMLNALTAFVHPLAKVITIEDTPELQVPHDNWLREVVQTTKVDDTSGAITMFDLLKAALRQRPNLIVVGEIRGPEGNIAFQAMQTGHAVMATFHASSVEKLIQRLTNSPISVPKTYVDNLNVAVLMSTVRLPSGRMGRRITAIDEIVSYDSPTGSFNITESFRWDEATDTFDFTGNMTSFVLEHKIAPKLGIPGNQRRRVYAEVERRAKILTKLHQEHHITGFYEILKALGQAQRQGLF